MHIMPRPWFCGSVSKRRIAAALDDEPMRQPRDGERRLAGFIIPPFQRKDNKWTEAQKVALIESIWEGFPIPAYVVNRVRFAEECTDWLIDGQQRWTAITGYVANEFPVSGHFWRDLAPSSQREFRGQTIGEIETHFTDPALCHRIYLKLALSGTPHDQEDLQAAQAFRP
jgi:hypothetical protein